MISKTNRKGNMNITIKLSKKVFEKRLKEGIFEVEDKQDFGVYLVKEIDTGENYYVEVMEAK